MFQGVTRFRDYENKTKLLTPKHFIINQNKHIYILHLFTGFNLYYKRNHNDKLDKYN